MENKIKQAILEMLRMGEDPHELLTILSSAYHNLSEARDYVPVGNDIQDYAQAIKESDFRP